MADESYILGLIEELLATHFYQPSVADSRTIFKADNGEAFDPSLPSQPENLSKVMATWMIDELYVDGLRIKHDPPEVDLPAAAP